MDYVTQVLAAWAFAMQLVETNTTMLLDKPCEQTSVECERRMKVLEEAESDLDALEGVVKLPPVVGRYLKAKTDTGCAACRYSSNRHDLHPECWNKIQEFFRSRDLLYDYASTLT